MWVQYKDKASFRYGEYRFDEDNNKVNVKDEIGSYLLKNFPSKFSLTEKEAKKQEKKEEVKQETPKVQEKKKIQTQDKVKKPEPKRDIIDKVRDAFK